MCVWGWGDGVLTVNLGTGYGHRVHFEAIGSSELGMLSLSLGNLASQREHPWIPLDASWKGDGQASTHSQALCVEPPPGPA